MFLIAPPVMSFRISYTSSCPANRSMRKADVSTGVATVVKFAFVLVVTLLWENVLELGDTFFQLLGFHFVQGRPSAKSLLAVSHKAHASSEAGVQNRQSSPPPD